MTTTGIMEEIRDLLSQGKSSGEVIALGYAPGSVYKAQRRLRLGNEGNRNQVAQATPRVPPSTTDDQAQARLEQLESENADLSTQVAELGQEVGRLLFSQSELDELRSQLDDLTSELHQSLEECSQCVQTQARRIDTLERQVKCLEETVPRLGLLALHLDVHHRLSIHGWPADPTDRDYQFDEASYRTLLHDLQEGLSGYVTGVENRQRLGLSIRFKDLAWQVRSHSR